MPPGFMALLSWTLLMLGLIKVKTFVNNPVTTQRRLLVNILRRASHTEWGRRLNFAAICRSSDPVRIYQERVPLHEYPDIADDVQRMQAGGSDILSPGVTTHYAVSSGTTDAGKIIPVSDTMLRANKRFGTTVGLQYLIAKRRPGYLFGKHLGIPGRIEDDARYPGTLIGEVSGLQALFAPALYRYMLQAVPNEMAFMPHWNKKLKAIADHTMDMDVRTVILTPSWAPVLFKLLINNYNARHGTSINTVAEIWPRFNLFISGGVALSSYRSVLEDLVGNPKLDFMETYGASEGFFAFQTDPVDPSMLLHLDNEVFFEFVRLDEIGSASARRHTIADVEADVRYAPYLTTCSGLYGYKLGDVVRFTSTRPYKIVVAGRTAEMLDGYGEAVYGEDARQAIEAACAHTGAQLKDYHIAPRLIVTNRLPAHQWLVEFERSPEAVDTFTRVLDEKLSEINRHYYIRREGQALDPPELVCLPPGTIASWLNATRAVVSTQTKVPRMRDNRSVADGILAFVSNK